MRIKLTGKLAPCEVCAQAKIRQANKRKKKMKILPTRPGYMVVIDICSFKQVSRGGNRHWLIVVDEFSDCSHSFFLSRKSDQIQLIPMWIKGLAKKYGIEIKRIRLDNSGENKSLQKECHKENLGVIFEFTAPGTPQQDAVAERRIPTLMGRARAMLIQAGIDSKEKVEFWCEVISTATKLHNIMVRPERTKKYMRTFGEMAVVAIHEGKKMRSKLDNREKTCMFVGYAEDHAGDVYRFLNIHTKRIILSRDVRWFNIIWKQYQMKSIYARKHVELFLDEEERSIEDEKSYEEDSVVEEEEETQGDGHNTLLQKKLGLDINMIGARKETLGKQGVKPRKCPLQEMNPWKEHISQEDPTLKG